MKRISFIDLVFLVTMTTLLLLRQPTAVMEAGTNSYMASGTAWVLNEEGYVCTAYHVVKDRLIYKVKFENELHDAKLIAIDKVNDIAILKISAYTPNYLSLQFAYEQGEFATEYGYPMPATMGHNLKTSDGFLARSLGDGYSFLGQSCYGNSGGPVIGTKGVVGLVYGSTDLHAETGCASSSFGASSRAVADVAKRAHVEYYEAGTNGIYADDSSVLEIVVW